MRSPSTKLRGIASRLLVPMLLLWFGSISYLNCCAPAVVAGGTSADEARQPSAHSCASLMEAAEEEAAASADCCASVQDEHCSKAIPTVSTIGAEHSCDKQFMGRMRCCSPAGQSADRTRKARLLKDERERSLASNQGLRQLEPEAAAPLRASTSNIRDRSGTYLRACVFLI